jgi:hypothetical protein
MANEVILPNELIEVATSLEKQFQVLGVPSRKIPLAEWDCLSPKVRNLIPQWLIALLANHSLAGALLERPHEIHNWERYFSFWTPSNYAERVTPDDPVASRTNGWWLTEEFIKDGFISLSDESDGDEWLTSIRGDASSPVYIYDLSGRQRKIASENLARFLASCKVSKKQ